MNIHKPISKKYLTYLVILAAASLIIYSCNENKHHELYEYEDGIYYIELDGSPSQMGKKHGHAFKDNIHKAVENYKQTIYSTFGQENGKLVIDWAITKAGFVEDIKKYIPNVYDEIVALAEAAELLVEDILLINFSDEITEAAPVALNIEPKHTFTSGATIMQVQTDDREKLCAQNLEYTQDLNDQQLMIRYKYPDREILIYTFVGRVGGIGINSKGLSVLAAKLPQGINSTSGGLPLNYTLRLILEQNNVDDALAKLKQTKRSFTYSYALADYKKSLITEESGEKFISSPMLQYPGFQCHTNHMLWIEPKNRIDIPGIFENGQALPESKSFYTAERLTQAKSALTGDIEEIDDDELQNLLTTANINSEASDYKTIQSAIIEYDEEALDMIISAGANPQRKWNRYDF